MTTLNNEFNNSDLIKWVLFFEWTVVAIVVSGQMFVTKFDVCSVQIEDRSCSQWEFQDFSQEID
jgi:hypothetical protein